jgi:hypothetical protein
MVRLVMSRRDLHGNDLTGARLDGANTQGARFPTLANERSTRGGHQALVSLREITPPRSTSLTTQTCSDDQRFSHRTRGVF